VSTALGRRFGEHVDSLHAVQRRTHLKSRPIKIKAKIKAKIKITFERERS
jgi:hypothetical protein